MSNRSRPRRPDIRRGRACWLLSLLFLLPFPHHAQALTGEERAAREARLQEIQQRIREQREALERAGGRKAEESRRLERLERKIGEVDRSLRRIGAEVRGVRGRIAGLERERADQERRLAEQRRLLAAQVRASYVMGRQEQLKLLLNQEDPSAVQRMLAWYGYIARARLRRIEAVRETLARLAEVRAELEMQRGRLETLLARQEEERHRLAQQRAQRAELVASLGREIRDRSRRLTRLQEDERELQRLLDAIGEALESLPLGEGAVRTFAELRGRLPWPVKGRLRARFGSRRPHSELRWKGVLLDAPNGAEVRAVARGRVAFADWLRGFGMLIIVDHGDGFMSLYGHNQGLYKEVGEWVEAGEVIASVGDSGGQSRSALYFEIRREGRPLDPVRWCRR